MVIENAQRQIKRLADFILKEVPGEPSKNQGAIDTAIRVIRTMQKQINRMDVEFKNLTAKMEEATKELNTLRFELQRLKDKT